MKPLADVALLTDSRYTAATAAADDWYLANILADDSLLQDALARRCITSVRVDWANPDVDWEQYRCAVFRSTWDYHERPAEFSTWLQRVESTTILCNPAETIRWNMDKHYLRDLQERGMAVVPSRFVERGTKATLAELLAETRWSEAVVKPCVSGAARHTYRVTPATAGDLEHVIQQLLAVESLILQPFQQDIINVGEDTLMVFGGRYSHAVRKVAKVGDFRVQDDHGGTTHHYQPTNEQIEMAERVVAACRPTPAYARVDLIRSNEGQLAVMELELIEPELWLRFHPPAAETFADAIVGALSHP